MKIKNSIYGVLEAGITPLIMIILTPIFVRTLGVEQYGIWIIVNSIIATLAIFNFGVVDIVIKYVSEYIYINKRENIIKLFTTIYLFQIIISLVIIGIIICINYLGYISGFDKYYDLFLIGIIIFFIKQSEQIIYAFFKAHLNYKNVTILSLLSKVLFFTGQAVTAIYTGSIYYIFLFSLIISFIVYLCELIYVNIYYSNPIQINKFSLSQINLIYSFGIWNWLASLISILNVHIDKWIISSVFGMTIFGYYSIGILIFNQLHTIFASSISWVLPKISSSVLTKDEEYKLFKLLLFVISVISLVLSFILINIPGIFLLWLGEDMFKGSFYYINFFLIIFPLYTLSITSYYYLLALSMVKEKFRIDFKVLFIKSILLLLLSIYLGKEFIYLGFIIYISYEFLSYILIINRFYNKKSGYFIILLVFEVLIIYGRLY